MSVDHDKQPDIYWVTGNADDRHEIPPKSIVCIFDKSKGYYMETWIDQKTGVVQFREGGPKCR